MDGIKCWYHFLDTFNGEFNMKDMLAALKTAGTKSEYYKFEFADGEKHAYQDATKKLRTVLDKNLQVVSVASL